MWRGGREEEEAPAEAEAARCLTSMYKVSTVASRVRPSPLPLGALIVSPVLIIGAGLGG
jgi:hypothetical protein